MINELYELIETIPDELKDCFVIEINPNDAMQLREEHIQSGYNSNSKVEFPIEFHGIFTYIGKSYSPKLMPKPAYICLKKIYDYEMYQFKKFIQEFEKLSNKYNCFIGGCGCCGSPNILNFHTFTVECLKFNDGKVSYDLEINYAELKKGIMNE